MLTLVATCSLVACLPGSDDAYTGSGPMLSGTYELVDVDIYQDACDDEPQTDSMDGYFKLQREEFDGGEILAWYDCSTPDTCDLAHKRNMSFYQPRPESWRRLSLWAVEGVGECILRNETAYASLHDDTLTIDSREYRESIQGVSPENCVRERAASIASPGNCARREVMTATVVSDGARD